MADIFDWDDAKNEKLLAERGLSFETIVAVIEQYGVLDDIENPSANFPHQRALIVAIDNYAIIVPYVTDGETKFLKTAFPTKNQAKTSYLIFLRKRKIPAPQKRNNATLSSN